MKFRKKPVVVDAMLLQATTARGELDWFLEGVAWERDGIDLMIPTLEGVMRAHVGDWIIRGVKGEFYPCKPDIFEATYEAVP